MMKRWFYPPLLLGPLLYSSCLAQPLPESPAPRPPVQVREAAPSPLPRVQPVYEDVRYWIDRQPDPENILMTAGEIEQTNRSALKRDPEAVDIFSLPAEMDAGFLKTVLTGDQERYGNLKIYDLTNLPVSADYLVRLFSRMDLKAIPASLKPLYGVITRETNLRVLPTDDLAMDRPFDYAFDRFQSGKLDCGTAVAVFHYSDDRSWCYVETGYARGWIRPNDVALGAKEEVRRFAAEKPLVVSGDAVPFYRDQAFRQFVFDLPMGARLPLAGKTRDHYQVCLPWRDGEGGLVIVDGYVRAAAGVHEGYLPYTLGAVLRQAFKIKNSRYSWGGLNEGRDCSRFIMDVFRCFGFRMPRDSYRQAVFYRERRDDVGGWTESQKIDLLKQYEQTPTILYMRGHVMLFLGIVDGRAYAIHSYWDYSEDERPDLVYHVGRVVVSDLLLGKSGEGNLLKWITAVIPIR